MFATPDPFRLNQSPLGAVLLPQAPSSVGHTPLPEGLSLARAGSAFHRLTPNPGQPLSSLRNPVLWGGPRCLAYYR